MKKIRVLQVNKLYYPVMGGIEKVIQQLAEGLRETTDETVLVCQKKGKTRIEQIHGVEVCRAGSVGVWKSVPLSVSFFSEFKRLSKQADLIQFHLPFPLGDVACLLSGYKGKVVLWWHSDIVKQKKLLILYKPFMLWLLKRADAIIVASEGHIEGSSYLPEFRDKCHVIPFGVDGELIQRAGEYLDHKVEPEEYPDELKFLFVGRLVYYKGCEVLLEAFSQIKTAKLVMIGEGVLEDSLKQQVKHLGMEDRVEFLGAVSQDRLNQEFERCDVFVLPSLAKSEAFGIVQIEAMAYGKPVINTWLPSGVPYVSLDQKTGLTVQPNDAAQLAQAMQWMIEHAEERLRMGRSARQRVEEHFTEERMIDRVLRLYMDLMKDV